MKQTLCRALSLVSPCVKSPVAKLKKFFYITLDKEKILCYPYAIKN